MFNAALQLHLPIELVSEPTLAEYLPGPNAEAVAAIRGTAIGGGEPFIFLFGPPETGKSHLLQAACLAAAQVGRQAHYIPLGRAGIEPDILESLERLDLVALDDVERIAGAPIWERAVFDLFNRLRERRRALIAAASAPPDDLALGLPDLRSRLHWGPRYRLLPLTERDIEALLCAAARRRGMPLPAEVTRYILTHHPRHPSALLELVARIDSLSLREQRPPTIPLVRRVMRGGEELL
ncbi:DnaA regulatory inactivator Hda [uncultured Thiodictyon sp.]|uniref:DnaA regulatory inactivator Hda n=1 Tax=uncultured Thiodictyon sp. TaxID=1846217 RepID=UPI0025E56295|nr:DnaA regulatory inactivator Hda [uncultured Thiodictyon sp.]